MNNECICQEVDKKKDLNNDQNDDNPFGDQNAVDTPLTERDGFTW